MFDTRRTVLIKSVLVAAAALVVMIPVCLLFAGSFMGADEVYDKIGPVLAESSERSAKWFLLPE